MSTKSFLIVAPLLLFFNATGFSQSQSIEVEYTFEINSKGGQKNIFFKKLIDNGESALFTTRDSVVSGAFNQHAMPLSKSDYGMYYHRPGDSAFYWGPIMQKGFYVADDSLQNRMKWSLVEGEEKTILNYKCHAARLSFRGRNYTAYYTDALPFSSGPYKFFGLPGLILEIKTDDNRFSFSAYKITILPQKTSVINPYVKNLKDFVSFKQYKDAYAKKIVELNKKLQASEKDEDVTYQVEDESMELFN